MTHALDLRVDSSAAIVAVQNAFREQFDYKSVAQELIQNSLDENQIGDLSIRRNLILLEVAGSTSEELSSLEKKVTSGIQQAKRCFSDKSERIRSMELSAESSKKPGRGFFLMFCLGWDVVTLKTRNKLLIAAVKR